MKILSYWSTNKITLVGLIDVKSIDMAQPKMVVRLSDVSLKTA